MDKTNFKEFRIRLGSDPGMKSKHQGARFFGGAHLGEMSVMKFRTQLYAACGIFFGAVLLLAGCGGSSVNVITVTVSPASAVVIAGQVQTFTATVGGSTTTTVTNWPCTYSYTPLPTATTPNPTAVTGNCTSGGTITGVTGNLGTWVITTTNGSNVLTYTAPSLTNFPNPIPTLTFTATADADKKKTGTATVALDSGIRVSVTPATVTVPVGLTPPATVALSASFLNTPPLNQVWKLVQPNSSSSTVTDQTATPLTPDTCDPTCGAIDANGVFTAPATLPTDTKPAGSASTAATTVYAVVSSASDPTHYAIATITLVAATTNSITFNGISPTTIPAGGIEQDIFLDAKNFLNTTKVYFTAPGQPQGPPIDSSNIYTIPISPEYCTASASGVTPVVTCDASLMTRVRLTQSQLGLAGLGQITVADIPGTATATTPCVVVPNADGSTNTTSISCPLNLVYAPPALIAAVPDSFPQGQSATLAVNGGYYGGSTTPIVKLLLDDALDTVSTFGPRQFVGTPAGSQLSSPGLYEVSIQSNAPLGSQPTFPIATTNVAVQPVFADINTIYHPVVVPPQPYPPNIALAANSLPSSMAVDSAKGFAVMTEQGINAIQLIDLTGSVPALTGSATAGSSPTSIAIDTGINIPGYPKQDLGVVVSSGDSKLYLYALSRTTATAIGKPIPVDLATLLQQSGSTGLATPFAIGVDPGTHLAALAYANSNIGFIVDVNPNLDGTDTRACFLAAQTPPCVVAPVSLNTGPTPQVILQPQAPFAYVTPGGTGSTSVIDLLQQGHSAPIAPAVTNGTSGAVRTTGITKIITPLGSPHGINPALGGTVIISGLTPTDFDGTYQVIPGSVTDPYTFSYAQPGLADETETNTAAAPGEVQYGTPYYSFNTTNTVSGAAINPVTRTAAFADYNLSSQQIQFIATLDQTVTSLSLAGNSCHGCQPDPADAPELNFRSVAFDPYTNVLIAYDPTLDVGTGFITNAISLINPGGPGDGTTLPPYRIIQAILTGQVGQGSYTPPGATAPVAVYGPMAYDPKSKFVLVGNAGSNTLTYVNLDPSNAFKPVAIQKLQIASNGVANGQPALGTLIQATCDPTNATTSCMAQAVPLGQPAVLQIFGQGFNSGGAVTVRLDTNAVATCSSAAGGPCTIASDGEVDVTIPASILTAPHDFSLDVQVGSLISNAVDLYAVGVLNLASVCPVSKTSPQGPEAVAIDSVTHVAYITNFACGTVSAIAADPNGYVKQDKSIAPYGTLLGSPVTVGTNPVGIDVIDRNQFHYAVVANNGDSPTGSASIIDISNPEAMAVVTITSTNGTTTTTSQTVPVGLSPLGVTIDKDRALALIANNGSNTVTAIDLTVLLPGAVTTKSPTPTTVAVSGAPTAIAVDPNAAIAVVTLLQNSGSTTATAGLDVINLGTSPPVRSTSASVGSLTASLTGIVTDPVPTGSTSALFYATSTQQNAVYSFNPTTGSTQLIRVGINPYGLAYNYQTGALFTINSTSDTSSLIDSQNFKTRQTLGISSQSQFPVAIDNFYSIAIIVDQNNNRVLFLGLPK